MTIFNNRMIPFFLRITNTKQIDEKHQGRRDTEWGYLRITSIEKNEFHLMTKEEREKDE